jgi:CheY-like chemotaxis protein
MQVSVADSAVQARTMMLSEGVDVILADYHLHGQPAGLELLVELTRASLCPGALITADANATLAQQARSLGFQVLRKPVRPAALRALLAALLHASADLQTHTLHTKVGVTV